MYVKEKRNKAEKKKKKKKKKKSVYCFMGQMCIDILIRGGEREREKK